MGELAAALKFKESFVSRLVKSLKEKNLAAVKEDGVFKRISINSSMSGKSFKELYSYKKNARFENWLSGHSLELLVLAANGAGIPLELVFREAGFSKPTFYS